MAKAKKKKQVAKRAFGSALPHSHPSYGYIAVGFIFVVLVLLVSGLQ